ncbi:MAG TPA: hypothetical protein VIN38_05945 [Thiobacillus sp.]
MTELFEMLSSITRRRKSVGGSPFASVKATEKWLKNLPSDSDYDAHHGLVEGLERFNADHGDASLVRMKCLMKIEAAGLPLQHGIIEQYLKNQAAFRLARQALWRESWVFWSLLSEAWLFMLKQAYRGTASAELRPHAAEMAARAIHYARLVMRWDYHQARTPPGSAWRRIHKVYRLVERDGFATQEVLIGGVKTHCAREYSLAVLMGLVHPVGYRAQEIESIADIVQSYQPLPLPNLVPERDVHTHLVDLSLSEGACVMEDDWVQGRRLRYFDLSTLVSYLKDFTHDTEPDGDSLLMRQVASLIERGGIRRNRERTHRFGRVWVAAGMNNILTALASPDPEKTRPALEPWMLRDESTEGMGFALPEEPNMPHGRLIAVSWDPAESVWQLMAIRWNRQEDGQHMIGTQRLSRHPKRVEISHESQVPQAASEKIWAVFLPMTHTEQGVSNLLIPQSHYLLGAPMALRDGDVVYRLRLGEIQESHEGWLRVGMDIIGREQFAEAA